MKPVFTAAESRAGDAAVIASGTPSIDLMRTAARALTDVVLGLDPAALSAGVAVVCGPGNNGGDGFSAARMLHEQGISVWLVPLTDHSGGDAAIERAAAVDAGVVEHRSLAGAGVVIDALFGTGLSRPIDGTAAEFIAEMGEHPGIIVAADVPSGLDSDTGSVWGIAPVAHHTVAFGGEKRGMFCRFGPQVCGEIHVVDLGLDPRGAGGERVEHDDIAARWPWRAPDAHKGSSGHLLVIAGSAQMAGASVLTCRGALAAGAGLVTLLSPRGAWSRLATLPPEVMVIDGGEGDHWDGRLPDLARFTAIAVGPGLGRSTQSGDVGAACASLIAEQRRPMVVDADALSSVGTSFAGPRVITPHEGEAARMLGLTREQVHGDRFGAVGALASRGVVAVLKGPHTLVAEDGQPVAIHPTANPVLASGGTGDVLTGVIGALLCRLGSSPSAARDAALCGVWVHGAAADGLAARRREGWTASDVAAALPDAIQTLTTAPSSLP